MMGIRAKKFTTNQKVIFRGDKVTVLPDIPKMPRGTTVIRDQYGYAQIVKSSELSEVPARQ